MKPWIELGRAKVAGTSELVLRQRDDTFVIRVDGQELMSSRLYGSEKKLAEIGCAGLTGAGVRVLIGGLGLGYTLRAALDTVGPKAEVVIAEISPAVVEWNRTYLGHLASRPLDDPRVTLFVGDVGAAIREAPGKFNAILLDVDNSAEALCLPSNDSLYTKAGLIATGRALRPHGVYGVWTSERTPSFERRLRGVGFQVEVHDVRARAAKAGLMHAIYIGRRGP
jgi:spermidine synthase